MHSIDTPEIWALEVEADLVECPVNFLVSIPAFFKRSFIHLDTVVAETLSCGFIYDIRSWETWPRKLTVFSM